MAVRLRMKKMGRRHRPFYRICAVDSHRPRDGRVLEELGTYDPMIPETDARATLNTERIDYWIGVGAQPSDKVGVLIRKYGSAGTHLEQQRAAVDRLAESRRRVVTPPPTPQPKQDEPKPEEPKAEEPKPEEPKPEEPKAEAPAEAATEAPAEAATEEKSDE